MRNGLDRREAAPHERAARQLLSRPRHPGIPSGGCSALNKQSTWANQTKLLGTYSNSVISALSSEPSSKLQSSAIIEFGLITRNKCDCYRLALSKPHFAKIYWVLNTRSSGQQCRPGPDQHWPTLGASYNTVLRCPNCFSPVGTV